MKRYGLLLLVTVLAVTSLLAAAAYNTAQITNAAEVTVANTTNGLLALVPGDDPDETAYVSGGRLYLDFDKGWPHGARQPQGLQPASIYFWDNLFKAVNLSHGTIAFRVDLLWADGTAVVTNQFKITITCDGVVFVNENTNTASVWTEGPYFNKFVDVKIEIMPGATLTWPNAHQLIFRVTGTRI